MRPSTIVTMITAVVVGIVAVVCAILAFVSRAGHRPWFYWIAPLVAIGAAGAMANLLAEYYVKIGRIEAKGRPRR